MKLKIIAAVAITALLLTAGAGAAVTDGFSDTVSISFGEVEYTDSALTVESTEFVGPGNNVESVNVTVSNPSSSNTTDADTNVYLIDSDGNVITQGSSTDTFSSGGNTVVEIDVDKTNRNQIGDLDIRVEEV